MYWVQDPLLDRIDYAIRVPSMRLSGDDLQSIIRRLVAANKLASEIKPRGRGPHCPVTLAVQAFEDSK